jgi:putative ABC transport system permease protein
MLGIAGGIALLLSSIGVYGVIAYSVSQRTQEIGVRMALGAQPRDVLWVFLGKGIALIFFGLLVGLATSVAVTRLISSLLLGVTPTDPLTFIIAPAFLVSVALAACYFPARRAMRVNPQVALRCE